MGTKTDRIEARVEPGQRMLLEEAAAARGQSLSGFLLGAALAEATAVVSQARWTVIPADFAASFTRLLDAPPGALASQFSRLGRYEPLVEADVPRSASR